MSQYIRSAKRPAAIVFASLMLLTTAAAQDAAPAPKPDATPPAQQSTTSPASKPTATPSPTATTLPEIQVRAKKRVARPAPAPAPPAALPPPTPPDTQDTRTGTVGVYANSTSVATKTNTPLLNIPQSITVVTKDFIRDQGYQNLTDVTRYIPGVAVHQGEGNRDELVIRGVDSSANFFVNGFRDDVQIFRDLYNTQSIELLRGPSALTFGRGVGGGLLNRTLKEAEFRRIYEATMQTGSFYNRRITLDAGQAINQDLAVRLNAMYEGSDTFRDYGKLERYGINPTLTWRPTQQTKVKLSYEYFHDNRTADRGNPSYSPLGLPLTGAAAAVNAAMMRAHPATPFAPGGDITTFFGSPSLNVAHADVHTVMGFIEHDFQNGLTVKNGSLFADYKKFYQNVYPGNGPLAGAVSPDQTSFNLAAYQHETDRQNLINQTDFTYKNYLGPFFHTFGFGTEFAQQTGIDVRNTGIFPNGTNTILANPFNPTYFGTINFVHHASATGNTDGVTAADSNLKYSLDTQSGYVRDTIDLVPWLQVLAGLRYDRFDVAGLDMNVNALRSRVDEKLSKQAAVIFKPRENLSFYGAYSTSFLPASGDQFSSITPGTVSIAPQKFENKEIGLKWNIFPRLQYTAAIYDLKRTNVPIADPSNPGFFLASGSHHIRGFETQLTGYVTDAWQMVVGYAYTDARITSATSVTVVPGNIIQLVPFNQFSLWNKYQINPVWAGALGVIYFSDSFASSDDTVRLPGFVRFDGAIYAKINETWKAQLNVENILNTRYLASADGNNNISPGQSRTLCLKAIATF
jgi:catecholate siderophore receptor